MDFTPLINSALLFKKLILGIGLLIVLIPRSVRTILAVAVILGLLIFVVPESVPYLLAVWRAVFDLFRFLLLDFRFSPSGNPAGP